MELFLLEIGNPQEVPLQFNIQLLAHFKQGQVVVPQTPQLNQVAEQVAQLL
jgi:hypothetical protein